MLYIHRVRVTCQAGVGPTTVTIATLTTRLQLNPDFDRGFPRSEFRILTNMRMYNKFGAMQSSIEIGIEMQSNRWRGNNTQSLPVLSSDGGFDFVDFRFILG